MGGVAVLNPQDCLKEQRHNLFSTPVKSRRSPKRTPSFSNSIPNFTRSEGRKRSPPTGVRKNKTAASEAMVAEPPRTAFAKNLVMGQVKILKRGESLDESSTILKHINDLDVSNGASTTSKKDDACYRDVSNGTSTTPKKDVVCDRKVSCARKVVSAKKKPENKRRSFSSLNPKIDDLETDDFALSSTNRLGPDPEMVPKQMKKNIAEFFFAGSVFVDSPPPSSLPLPGFFTKNFVAAVKEDPSNDLRRLLGLSLS